MLKSRQRLRSLYFDSWLGALQRDANSAFSVKSSFFVANRREKFESSWSGVFFYVKGIS